MAFLTPCFARVEDAAERKKLIEWLEGIGYTHLPFISESDKISTDANGMIWLTDANRGGAYDCGTNVELFRALSAMNDENDLEQWFVTKTDSPDKNGRIYDCFLFNGVVSKIPIYMSHIHKATAEEIIEYFKKREK